MKKKSLAEYQRESQGGNPWLCRRCGANGRIMFDVKKTYDVQENHARRRRMVCKHCGQTLIRSDEVAVPEGFKVVVVPEDEDERCAA